MEQAMTDITTQRQAPLPKAMPMLLSFVAGYVDSYTYLALFGLFAAQVTGSFVIAGAELVTHDYGVAGKLLAIVAFLVAAAITAGLIHLARNSGVTALPLMLALEATLLAIFAAMLLFGPRRRGDRRRRLCRHQCARRIARSRHRRGACALGALSRETCLSVITRESGWIQYSRPCAFEPRRLRLLGALPSRGMT